MAFDLTYKPYGERSILIEWPQVINRDILMDVLSLKDKIVDQNIESIRNIIPAYNSLLVSYDFSEFSFEKSIKSLKALYHQDSKVSRTSFCKWRIPVCYDLSFGIDLKEISVAQDRSVEEIIRVHSQTNYTVYFIGFLPGFLYLGGLDESLHIPRKRTPRLKIHRGAVAIGGKQTGVYPKESPGGWNIIGNTPISFFDATREEPCFAKPGDSIKFYPISLKEYHNTKALVDAGVHQMESEVIDD